MNVTFNPFNFALSVVSEAYPDLDFELCFAYLDDEDIPTSRYQGPWGCAEFGTEGAQDSIVIDPRLPINAFAEILMHEVAHLVAGPDAEHSEKWDEIFMQLNNKYNDMFEKAYSQAYPA